MKGTRAYAWLWLLVAAQIAIPASYYLWRDDRDDERFAWRMFSAVRVKKCQVSVFDGRAGGALSPVELDHLLHSSWQHALERGRRRVIARFLAQRCGEPSIERAVLDRRCQTAGGERLPTETYAYLCALRSFSREVAP